MNIEFSAESLPDSPAGNLVVQVAAVNFSALENPTLLDLLNNLVMASATYKQIDGPPCIHALASMSITPAVSAPVSVGTPVDYTVSITNHDSAACPPRSFLYGNPGTLVPGYLAHSPVAYEPQLEARQIDYGFGEARRELDCDERANVYAVECADAGG